MAAPPSLPTPQGQFGMSLGGMSGMLPFTGNVFYVNESTGSDGYDGGMYTPLATLSQAHSLCTSGNNDVVFLTGTVHTTATTTWSKSKTHLIGLAPTLRTNARARISATGTVFTPLVSATGSECIFMNIGAFHGFADASAQICWADTGGRNSYQYCAFLGMANATAGAQTGGRSLVIDTAGENYFIGCQIGLDTITRSAANASLEFKGGTPRNTFDHCEFPAITTSASAVFVTTSGAAAIDRAQYFQDCLFANMIQSTSTQMTVGFTMSASAGGMMLLQRCTSIGATKWGNTAALAQMYVDGGAPTAATSGLAISPS